MKTPCLLHTKCYFRAKVLIYEELLGNSYGIRSLDKIELKIDQWVAVLNKLFSNYDAKSSINEISRKISKSDYEKKIDRSILVFSNSYFININHRLDSIVFIKFCIEEFVIVNKGATSKEDINCLKNKKSEEKFHNKNKAKRSLSSSTIKSNISKEERKIDQIKEELEKEKFEKFEVKFIKSNLFFRF